MTSPRPDWLAPLADPRSEAILRAAFDVFVDKGIQGATMLDVAREARVSKETLYARFDSKEGLFYALLAWGCRQGAIDAESYGLNTLAEPVQALRLFGQVILTSMMRPESLSAYRIVISESGRTPDIGRAFNDMGCIGEDDFRGNLVRRLVDSGAVEIADEADFYDTFFGLLRGNHHHDVLTGMRPIPDETEIAARAAAVTEKMLRLYAPRTRQEWRAA